MNRERKSGSTSDNVVVDIDDDEAACSVEGGGRIGLAWRWTLLVVNPIGGGLSRVVVVVVVGAGELEVVVWLLVLLLLFPPSGRRYDSDCQESPWAALSCSVEDQFTSITID